MEKGKFSVERLNRAKRNVIAGTPLLGHELGKAYMLREVLPKRLAGKFSPEVIRRIESELDDIIASSMADVEEIARGQLS